MDATTQQPTHADAALVAACAKLKGRLRDIALGRTAHSAWHRAQYLRLWSAQGLIDASAECFRELLAENPPDAKPPRRCCPIRRPNKTT